MKRALFFIVTTICLQMVSAQPANQIIRLSLDLELIPLSERAYMHVSYTSTPEYGRFTSNGLIFVSNDSAFLFDTPTTDALTQELVAWIQDSMKWKLVGFAPNHWHNDCMGGLGYLQSIGIASFANQLTIEKAKKNQLPFPDHGFTDSLQWLVGGKTILCYYPGAAHTVDNIVVWIPTEKILFAGCMVKELKARNLGNTTHSRLEDWPQTIEHVIAKFGSAVIVIPGHGVPGDTSLLHYTKRLAINNQ